MGCHHTHYYHQARRATVVSMLVNAVLAVLKVFFGIVGHSHALFADGVHSTSDILTDWLVLLAARYGSQKADLDHPYGHARIETLATVGLAFVLVLAGMGIVMSALSHFISGIHQKPTLVALLVAFISLLANEGLYRYIRQTAQSIDSGLLHANAWHNRSDAITSFIVLLGVGGSWIGIPYLDGFAALIVGAVVIKMGAWDLGWKSIRELMDTGVDEITLTHIRALILDVPGVQSVHQVRTRMMNGRVFLDAHVQVGSYLSVSEGHYIGESVQQRLIDEVASIIDATVHIDPENDEEAPLSQNLPPRPDVLETIQSHCQNFPGLDEAMIVLHYLSGELKVDIHLSLKELSQETLLDIGERYRQALTMLPNFSQVNVFFKG